MKVKIGCYLDKKRREGKVLGLMAIKIKKNRGKKMRPREMKLMMGNS